jgi:hypothetical protein
MQQLATPFVNCHFSMCSSAKTLAPDSLSLRLLLYSGTDRACSWSSTSPMLLLLLLLVVVAVVLAVVLAYL